MSDREMLASEETLRLLVNELAALAAASASLSDWDNRFDETVESSYVSSLTMHPAKRDVIVESIIVSTTEVATLQVGSDAKAIPLPVGTTLLAPVSFLLKRGATVSVTASTAATISLTVQGRNGGRRI